MSQDETHFPVISHPDEEQVAKGELAPGESNLYDEEAVRESTNEPVGFVHLITRRSRRKATSVICRVVFNFDEGENTLTASGVLPSGSHVVDGGRLAISGGTGMYAGRQGEVFVEVWNPRRWSIA